MKCRYCDSVALFPGSVCTSLQFQCGDGSCIDVRRKCDKYSDCDDGSDEQGCGTCWADGIVLWENEYFLAYNLL